MLENDTEYLRAVVVRDLAKARGLENMDRRCAREPICAAMVYVRYHDFPINIEPKDSA